MSYTHLKGLSITPDPRGSTALDVTGTANFDGAFIQTGGMNQRVGSAANGVVGLKNILAASAGSAVVATTKVLGSSRILLTPIGISGVGHRALSFSVPTIASGTSFKINLFRHQTAGTLATASGRIAWQIINK